MGLRSLFGQKKEVVQVELPDEQAVIATFHFPDHLTDKEILDKVYELEDKLEEALNSAGVGDCDGHDLGEGEVTLYLYGPDADQVYEAAEPILREAPSKPVRVIIRYGKADDKEAKEVKRSIV